MHLGIWRGSTFPPTFIEVLLQGVKMSTFTFRPFPQTTFNLGIALWMRSISFLYWLAVRLMRLAIPFLSTTCKNYLKTVQPLLSVDAFDATEAVVHHFKNSEGPKLQKLLEDYSFSLKDGCYYSGSYAIFISLNVLEFWSDMYLRFRQPLVINANPFMSFQEFDHEKKNDQVYHPTSAEIFFAVVWFSSLLKLWVGWKSGAIHKILCSFSFCLWRQYIGYHGISSACFTLLSRSFLLATTCLWPSSV